MSGKVADNDGPLGIGVFIRVPVKLMVEGRCQVSGRDHCHRDGECDAEAALRFLGVWGLDHVILPLINFLATTLQGACQFWKVAQMRDWSKNIDRLY